ncbi:MAG TPA: hypothetical protein VLD18_13430, partial [Verrucomicrobiae bacterium]|nr:hypothetical protein [Verrucomicrobiae bacterium]
ILTRKLLALSKSQLATPFEAISLSLLRPLFHGRIEKLSFVATVCLVADLTWTPVFSSAAILA